MPLRLLHHRGQLHDTLRLLHSSSFQHKTVSVSGVRDLALPRRGSIDAGALGGGAGGHACDWERGTPSEDCKAEFSHNWNAVGSCGAVVHRDGKGLRVKGLEFSATTRVTWGENRSLY